MRQITKGEVTMDFQRECLAYGEKIHLAKLEAKKSEERVAQLEYEFSRFQLEFYLQVQKQQEAQAQAKGA
jgi:hypothetical protein